MGLFVRFWIIASIFSAFCPYRGAYRCNIGILPYIGGYLYSQPPPILKRGNLGCRFAIFFEFLKFFSEKIFFLFLHHHHSSASRSRFVFCWLFSCKRAYFRYFSWLQSWVWFEIAYFWLFLGLFRGFWVLGWGFTYL